MDRFDKEAAELASDILDKFTSRPNENYGYSGVAQEIAAWGRKIAAEGERMEQAGLTYVANLLTELDDAKAELAYLRKVNQYGVVDVKTVSDFAVDMKAELDAAKAELADLRRRLAKAGHK